MLDLYKQQGFETVADPLIIPIQNAPYLRLTIWQTAAQMIPVQGAGKLALHDVANIHTVSTADGHQSKRAMHVWPRLRAPLSPVKSHIAEKLARGGHTESCI